MTPAIWIQHLNNFHPDIETPVLVIERVHENIYHVQHGEFGFIFAALASELLLNP